MRYHSLRAFVHGEPVLSASLVCAVISMFFAPPSAAYLGYIDTRVLILLFCLMAVVSGMQKYDVFDLLAQKLLAGRHALRTIVLLLTLLPFFASMAITNDVALITFVPFAILVLGLVGQRALLIPVIVLQTVAANLGSMVTPVGNPQNLFLYASYELSAGQFFGVVLPFALISLVGVAALALCRKSCILQVSFAEPKQITDSKRVTFFGVLFILCLLSILRASSSRRLRMVSSSRRPSLIIWFFCCTISAAILISAGRVLRSSSIRSSMRSRSMTHLSLDSGSVQAS